MLELSPSLTRDEMLGVIRDATRGAIRSNATAAETISIMKNEIRDSSPFARNLASVGITESDAIEIIEHEYARSGN